MADNFDRDSEVRGLFRDLHGVHPTTNSGNTNVSPKSKGVKKQRRMSSSEFIAQRRNTTVQLRSE